MITPEIAAFVVKDYLLPMFESDGKKLMKNQANKSPIGAMVPGGRRSSSTREKYGAGPPSEGTED